MGRELKRKQAKKDKKPLKEEVIKKNENPYDDIYKLLKTFGIILGVILLIYFLIAVLITKEIDWFTKDNNEEQVQKVEKSILAKNTFNQKEEEYYVYFYDFEDENERIATLINSKFFTETIYRVNTKDAFNSNFVTEEALGNSSVTSIDDLKVINPTLIKISGDIVVEYYETKDNIISYLEQ